MRALVWLSSACWPRDVAADKPTPDSAKIQNPVMAERHFGEGIHYYWAKNYVQAEVQFKQAVKYFDRDARYQYYLGLAMLQQPTKFKRDAAYFAFEKGAQLEAEARQIAASVSTADASEGIAAFLEKRAPHFPLGPGDTPEAYPWWETPQF